MAVVSPELGPKHCKRLVELVVVHTAGLGRLVARLARRLAAASFAVRPELVDPADHSPEQLAVGYRRKLDKMDKLEQLEQLEPGTRHNLSPERWCLARRNQAQDRCRAW